MTGNGKPKTYAELQTEAAQHWGHVARIREEKFRVMQEALAQAPDVRMRPDPTQPWSHDGIVCPCGGTMFHVEKWICVNGMRHRWKGRCTSCPRTVTWDWKTSQFVEVLGG